MQLSSAVAAAEKDKSAESDARIARLPLNMWQDQKRIWTSPSRFKANDLKWAVPLSFGTAFSFGVDHAAIRKLPTNPNTAQRASNFSNAGAAGFAALVAGQYFWGKHTRDERLRESGFLSGEAAIDSVLLTSAAKAIARRERPSDGTGQGRFFRGSALNSSMPSQHAAAAFAIATVVSKEYPGIMTKILTYGGAGAVAAARVAGKNHYPSDVVIGSAIGYFVGREVYNAHSTETKLNATFGSFANSDEPERRNPAYMASPYVPLDSWVYPVLDRLEAMGYFRDVIISARPWTRKQIAESLHAFSLDTIDDPLASDSVAMLRQEFAAELTLLDGAPNVSANLEQVYTRFMGISGQPLTDSMHFGQTIYNDYGRPYQEGFNQITGASAYATAGPFAFYVRGEYQHAPSAEPYSLATRTAIIPFEYLPIMPGNPIRQTNRARLLDTYVTLNLADWQISFGKQSLWWGPGSGTSLMYSNNAEPLPMLRVSNIAAKRLPWILRLLGPYSSTSIFGQLSGYHFLKTGPAREVYGSWETYVDPQPFLWGQQITIKPTENLEVGVSVTTILGGYGRPMTLETYKHAFSSSGNAQSVEPGDRRTEFSFRYRLPWLREHVMIYSGSLAEDEPNPIAYPRRSAWSPGLYINRMPGISKLDLRFETAYTDIPNMIGPAPTYRNTHYAGGYTNNGKIIGSWIGPDARGFHVQSSYWAAPDRKLSFSLRKQDVSRDEYGGGNLMDFGAQYSLRTRTRLNVVAGLQYERWEFPALAAGKKDNVSVGIQFSWEPKEMQLHTR